MLKQVREKSSLTSKDLTNFLFQSQERLNHLKEVTAYFHDIYNEKKSYEFYEKSRVK